ncbi:glycosyltransferase family 10 domain-containing protein [Flavobacterium piscisymbiosum]|uniref:Glycosyltransferase family 10 n=1 Tax=Flavobacterium piscisymbiosum TaxID=2893753 RepID=A0ABS8MAF9_9FLAO|nr:glycosyltransferase family 10 [Flavobacterium sp. F-30]MCC9061715.1 glycosyltransferase family 10 [Flavobacterium sp. F-30]
MKTIKIFKASSFSYTPFNNYIQGDIDFLLTNNIILVDDVNDSDIIISQNYKHLKKYFWRFLQKKKFLVWTHEPRFDTSFKVLKKKYFGLVKIHFMNVYTRDVFVSNLSFIVELIDKRLEPISDIKSNKNKKVVGLMSYYGGSKAPKLMKDGVNIDLIALRTQIAIEGSKSSLIDVYGRGWPEGISKEDSREGDWSLRKKTVLDSYQYNLCFENTIAFNYMTEKIWNSIENYCLPIYYGKGSNVYEIFPKNSFIDYSNFREPKELFDFIKQMPEKEYIERINKCIEIYNSISSDKDIAKRERIAMLNKTVEKLKYIFIS